MVIAFLFLLLIGVGLAGCSTRVCPDKTTVEVGVTETDSKNDKLQEINNSNLEMGKEKL